jgi:hypothetical protein
MRRRGRVGEPSWWTVLKVMATVVGWLVVAAHVATRLT